MLLHGRRDFQLHGFSRCLCARKLLLNAATLSHPGIFLAPEQIPVKSFFLFLSLTRMYTSVKFNPLSSRANGDRSWINHIYIFPIHDKRQPSHTDLLCFLSLRTSSALSLFHTFSLVSSFCTMVYHVAIFSNVFGNPVFFFYPYFSSFFFLRILTLNGSFRKKIFAQVSTEYTIKQMLEWTIDRDILIFSSLWFLLIYRPLYRQCCSLIRPLRRRGAAASVIEAKYTPSTCIRQRALASSWIACGAGFSILLCPWLCFFACTWINISSLKSRIYIYIYVLYLNKSIIQPYLHILINIFMFFNKILF